MRSVRDEVRSQALPRLGGQVLPPVWNRVWGQVREQVADRVGNQVGDEIQVLVWCRA